MNDFLNEAKEAPDQAKAAPAIDDVKGKAEAMFSDIREKTAEAFSDLKEKAAPVFENVKEKTEEAFSDLKEKAAPVVEKVRAGVSEAAGKVEDLFTPDPPGTNVKNELFDSLGEEVESRRAASMSKAEEMQKKLEELMKGGRE